MQNSYTMNNYILGMVDYASGEITDFGQVGVKALDELTLQYTLKEKAPYFMSLFQTNAFVPLCRSYFLSQGGAFGLTEFADARAKETYQYGIDQNHIAICGQFLCTNMTEKNSVTYVLNENYWNAANANLKKVSFLYNDDFDVSRAYYDFMQGNVMSFGMNEQRMELAKQKGDFQKYAYIGDVGQISSLLWFNLHRQTYANMADGAAPSRKTDAEKALSCAAMQNRHFRLAIGHAIDRERNIAQSAGEELAPLSIRNTLTPGTYVKLLEDITMDINGTPTTFPKDTWYGAIVQAQLDADGMDIQVWDAEKKTTDGWDAWLNVEKAKEELRLAVEELKTLGYEVTKETPVIIDYPYTEYNEIGKNKAYVMKTNIENAFDGLVRCDLIPLNNVTEMMNVALNTKCGAEVNTDMGGAGALGSDHGDPICYMEGLLPHGDGWLTPYLGLW